MSVKAGNIVHIGNGSIVIDRIQTGGPGQVNIKSTLDYEVGNYQSVGQVFEIPDLSFTMESRDVSTEIEALLLDVSGANTAKVVSNVARASNVVTLTTSAAHGYVVGDRITVSGVTNDSNSFNGVYVILTVPTTTTFTFADTGTNVTSVAATGTTPAVVSQQVLDFATARPLNLKSAFKRGQTDASPFDVIKSVGLPFLTLESFEYRFGTADTASQTATLKGDSIYYNQGSCYIEQAAGSGTAGQVIVTANPAYSIVEGGVTRRILGVTAGTKRLYVGLDYTESYGSVTLGAATTTITITAAVATTDTIRIMYASPTVENLPQSVHALNAVKPSSIKGRDIDLYLGGYDPNNPTTNKIMSVNAATASWRVNLTQNEEFGNYHYVDQDYDVPTVSGTVTIRHRDAAEFLTRVKQVGGVSDPYQSVPATNQSAIPLDIVLKNPANGQVLKVVSAPDARFVVPGYQARVQTPLDVQYSWTSDTGVLRAASF